MTSRFSVSKQRQTITKHVAVCCGCIGLSFLAIRIADPIADIHGKEAKFVRLIDLCYLSTVYESDVNSPLSRAFQLQPMLKPSSVFSGTP